MPFTIILALLAFLGLAVVFGIVYKMKGMKIAFIITGIALVVFSILYLLTVYAIVRVM